MVADDLVDGFAIDEVRNRVPITDFDDNDVTENNIPYLIKAMQCRSSI